MKLFTATQLTFAVLAGSLILTSAQSASARGFSVSRPSVSSPVKISTPRVPRPTNPTTKIFAPRSREIGKSNQRAGFSVGSNGGQVFTRTDLISGRVAADRRRRTVSSSGFMISGVDHNTVISPKGLRHDNSFNHGPAPLGGTGVNVSRKGVTSTGFAPLNGASGSVTNTRVRGRVGGFSF